jgi:hypothetical protein
VTVVYYSLLCDSSRDCDPPGRHERQWIRSVTSLRRHNPDLTVALCLYGAAHSNTYETARRAGVEVCEMGSYSLALGEMPEHWRGVLAGYPTLHKLLSLRRLATIPVADRLIYLDCDTYVFGDLTRLASRTSEVDFVAREEPGSRRSPHGYDAGYLDEDALAVLAAAEGVVSMPPYNTGVMVLSAGLAGALVALLEDFLWYAWRLFLGAALSRPEIYRDTQMCRAILASASPAEARQALAYPSSNLWIVEQIATWLTLGRLPGLRHAAFDRADVVQSNEFHTQPAGYVIAHYFSTLEDQFTEFARRSDPETCGDTPAGWCARPG